MNIDITAATTKLIKMAEQARDSGDALRFSQAVLNLTHAKTVVASLPKPITPK